MPTGQRPSYLGPSYEYQCRLNRLITGPGKSKGVRSRARAALPVGQGSYSVRLARRAGMHSSEQSQTLGREGEAEVFSSLKLAGFDGRVKAVLCEKELMLERRSGHTLHLRLDAITRLRHHHTPLMPRWMFICGIFCIYAAWRIFVGQIAIALLSFGIGTMVVFIIGRRPTLTLDTESGDCHTVYGNDASLMRLSYLAKRIKDGVSLEEARNGLELLEREADYPTISPLEATLLASGEANVEAPAVLDAFLSEYDSEEVNLLPAWAAEQQGEGLMLNEPTYTERIDEDPANRIPTSFERAAVVKREMMSGQQSGAPPQNPWAPQPQSTAIQPWQPQQQQQGFAPPANSQSYSQAGEDNSAFGGFDMFAEGGLFGSSSEPQQSQPYRIGETPGHFGQTGYGGADSPYPSPANQVEGGFSSERWQRADTRAEQQNSYGMVHSRGAPLPPANSGALHPQAGLGSVQEADSGPRSGNFIPSFLPSLAHGERQDELMRFDASDDTELGEEDVTPFGISEGLVASARRGEDGSIVDAEIASDGHPLEPYSRFRDLTEHRRPGQRRMRLRSEILDMRRARSGIRDLLLPSISRLGRIASAPRRLLQRRAGRGDGYSEVYGDEDGYEGDVYREENFQTAQALRLQSDQSYQAQVASEIQRLTQQNGGVLSDDVAQQLLRHIAEKGDERQQLFTAGPESIPDSFSELSSSSEIAQSANNIPGIARLDD